MLCSGLYVLEPRGCGFGFGFYTYVFEQEVIDLMERLLLSPHDRPNLVARSINFEETSSSRTYTYSEWHTKFDYMVMDAVPECLWPLANLQEREQRTRGCHMVQSIFEAAIF